MSRTYSLCCYERKLKLWVGQRDYLYEGKDYIPKLARFLHETAGEQLVFVCDDHIDSDEFYDCKEFEE